MLGPPNSSRQLGPMNSLFMCEEPHVGFSHEDDDALGKVVSGWVLLGPRFS